MDLKANDPLVEEYLKDLNKGKEKSLKTETKEYKNNEEVMAGIKGAVVEVLTGSQRFDIKTEHYKIVAYRIDTQSLIRIDVRPNK